ncbi:hypothetical protein, partial [Micrococcus sp. HSID17227]|uniref:hypothetical protein n=1 Tax=Micrococcus sp. HSID17227 TaxID=2419506 RepID=UPI000F90F13B
AARPRGGAFDVRGGRARWLRAARDAGGHGPVRLVDDLVDSRGSLAEAGRVLREAGAQGVLPLVLAQAG